VGQSSAEGDEVLIDGLVGHRHGYCVEADADGLRVDLGEHPFQTGQVDNEVGLDRLQRLED